MNPTPEQALLAHLEKTYPKSSIYYHLGQTAFLNDYHRHCRDWLIIELKKHSEQRFSDLCMEKLCDAALFPAFQRFYQNDPFIKKWVFDDDNGGGRKILSTYFEVQTILEAERDFEIAIYGKEYVEYKEAVFKQRSEKKQNN